MSKDYKQELLQGQSSDSVDLKEIGGYGTAGSDDDASGDEKNHNDVVINMPTDNTADDRVSHQRERCSLFGTSLMSQVAQNGGLFIGLLIIFFAVYYGDIRQGYDDPVDLADVMPGECADIFTDQGKQACTIAMLTNRFNIAGKGAALGLGLLAVFGLGAGANYLRSRRKTVHQEIVSTGAEVKQHAHDERQILLNEVGVPLTVEAKEITELKQENIVLRGRLDAVELALRQPQQLEAPQPDGEAKSAAPTAAVDSSTSPDLFVGSAPYAGKIFTGNVAKDGAHNAAIILQRADPGDSSDDSVPGLV